MHIREPVVAAAMAEGEPGAVDAHLMEAS